jgi:hypothetical protein
MQKTAVPVPQRDAAARGQNVSAVVWTCATSEVFARIAG